MAQNRRQRPAVGVLVGRATRVTVMLLAAVAFGLPLLWLVLAPSKSREALATGHPLSFGSLDGYATAWNNLQYFNDGQIVTWIVNSILYAGAAVAIALLTCIPAGYAMATYDFVGRRTILVATLIAMIVPSAALVLPLFLEMAALNLTNTVWSVILPLGLFPFGVYLSYLYYVTTLPRDLQEAARVDGASEARIFWSIGLPLGRPALGVVGFFSLVQAWNNYFLPFVMLTDDSLYSLQLGLQALISGTGAINSSRGATTLPIYAPEAALAALVAAAPVLLVFLFAQRYLVAGQVAGSVKG